MLVYLLSSVEVGAAGGGRISGSRKAEGRIDMRSQEVAVLDCWGCFCAAVLLSVFHARTQWQV